MASAQHFVVLFTVTMIQMSLFLNITVVSLILIIISFGFRVQGFRAFITTMIQISLLLELFSSGLLSALLLLFLSLLVLLSLLLV